MTPKSMPLWITSILSAGTPSWRSSGGRGLRIGHHTMRSGVRAALHALQRRRFDQSAAAADPDRAPIAIAPPGRPKMLE